MRVLSVIVCFLLLISWFRALNMTPTDDKYFSMSEFMVRLENVKIDSEAVWEYLDSFTDFEWKVRQVDYGDGFWNTALEIIPNIFLFINDFSAMILEYLWGIFAGTGQVVFALFKSFYNFLSFILWCFGFLDLGAIA